MVLTEKEDKINELALLSYDWDGKGALPIEKRVISNVRNLFSVLPSESSSRWRIFPDVNGTIMLVHRKAGIATISMGNEGYSYFARRLSNQTLGGESHFTLDRLSSIVKEIEKLLD